MSKVMFMCLLVLSQAACGEGEAVSVLHVRYSQQTDNTLMLNMVETGCKTAEKQAKAFGKPMPEHNVYGDASLIGKAKEDVYWSRDGALKVAYRVGYGLDNHGLGPCEMRIVPEASVSYENFVTGTKHGHRRAYADENALNDEWGALDEMRSGGFFEQAMDADGKEVRSIKKMKEQARARKLGEVLVSMFGEVNEVGQDQVAGLPCTIYKPVIFTQAGMDQSGCGWKTGGGSLPELIILRSHLNIASGASISSIAESVDKSASVPLSVLQPSGEWKNKPNGQYVKSKKTDGEWVSKKQRRQLRRAKAKRLKRSGGEK